MSGTRAGQPCLVSALQASPRVARVFLGWQRKVQAMDAGTLLMTEIARAFGPDSHWDSGVLRQVHRQSTPALRNERYCAAVLYPWLGLLLPLSAAASSHGRPAGSSTSGGARYQVPGLVSCARSSGQSGRGPRPVSTAGPSNPRPTSPHPAAGQAAPAGPGPSRRRAAGLFDARPARRRPAGLPPPLNRPLRHRLLEPASRASGSQPDQLPPSEASAVNLPPCPYLLLGVLCMLGIIVVATRSRRRQSVPKGGVGGRHSRTAGGCAR